MHFVECKGGGSYLNNKDRGKSLKPKSLLRKNKKQNKKQQKTSERNRNLTLIAYGLKAPKSFLLFEGKAQALLRVYDMSIHVFKRNHFAFHHNHFHLGCVKSWKRYPFFPSTKPIGDIPAGASLSDLCEGQAVLPLSPMAVALVTDGVKNPRPGCVQTIQLSQLGSEKVSTTHCLSKVPAHSSTWASVVHQFGC